jgi:hypothetical protein
MRPRRYPHAYESRLARISVGDDGPAFGAVAYILNSVYLQEDADGIVTAISGLLITGVGCSAGPWRAIGTRDWLIRVCTLGADETEMGKSAPDRLHDVMHRRSGPLVGRTEVAPHEFERVPLFVDFSLSPYPVPAEQTDRRTPSLHGVLKQECGDCRGEEVPSSAHESSERESDE